MSHIVEAFEVVAAPRFESQHSESRIAAHLLSQKAFWSAIRFSICGKHDRVVELRLESLARNQSKKQTLQRSDVSPTRYTRIIVAVWSDQKNDSTEGLLERLLPVEYSWSQLQRPALQELTRGQVANGSVQFSIARIVRRVEMIDLPRLMVASSQQKGTASSTTPTREIPNTPFVTLTQMQLGRYCVPVLGEIQETSGDWRQLFEELQVAAPATLSISIHPIDPDGLEADRLVGSHMGGFVDLIGSQLETAGFAQLGTIRRSCDRYLLNAANLGNLRIRVAATDPKHCIAIAHSAVARFGGMRAFEIKYPTKTFSDLADLADAELDFPRHEDSESAWSVALDRLARQLTSQNVKDIPNEQIMRYLVRMPHLYTETELEQLLRLPAANDEGLPGVRTQLIQPFYPSSMKYQPIMNDDGYASPPQNEIRIGRVSTSPLGGDPEHADQVSHWHTIPKNDLTKHALIVGSTGSGKTVTTTFLVRELQRLQIPFLVIEPVKTEYFNALKEVCPNLRHFNFEGKAGKDMSTVPDFFAFDPMRLQSGVTVARHVSYLKSCFEAAFPLEPWMALLLENSFMAYYTDSIDRGCCGLHLFTEGGSLAHRLGDRKFSKRQDKGVYPSFDTFRDFFLESFLNEEFPKSTGNTKDWAEEWRVFFRRRFINLSHGPLGRAFDKADDVVRSTKTRDPRRFADPVAGQQLFELPTVIELDAIPDTEQKSLIMAFLLTFLFEKRQVENARERKTGPVEPKHVVIIEEAHRLLARAASGSNRGDKLAGQDAKGKAVGLFVDMLAEIRAWRQGIFIVEQIPTKIVPEAVKNTNLKIMLRTTAAEDRDDLGSAMNFNEEQKRFVTGLHAERDSGIQYVVFEEGVDQPVMLTLPLDQRPEEANLFDRYFPKTVRNG